MTVSFEVGYGEVFGLLGPNGAGKTTTVRAISADRCQRGLHQRVALGRALLNDLSVLFLDEPTSGLDPVASREVHGLIASLRERGVTIFCQGTPRTPCGRTGDLHTGGQQNSTPADTRDPPLG